MTDDNRAAVFDVGRVLFQWQLRALFEKLIDDPERLDWFCTHVVSEEWHFQHDRGTPLAEMLPARMAEFPEHALLIAAYAARFNETVPGEVEGVHDIVRRLAERGVPLYCLTNFGDELFARFRPAQPIFDLFEDIVVSGTERIAKPDPRIYEILERRSGRPGRALFFTDDNPANVEAARARGWDAHLFTDAATLEAQLAASGLL
ncbi:2-haloacid dehalogenase [Erythrobacter litoralis]|jgi:2-haloacid dehalogenase|uniref:Hydrolase n=1 Tax=Erythrobacter litoralis TaxID=39960 RepID=A0A074MK82_9SPHN|nr:HAD family phosphatase [Erythrobacter litoralis]AOL22453.1 2-haloacid dehalogenase [Erythrobacter litoralis]KEO92273.1 hydrolase [Erythrobacter litoralis]MEE4337762.1 HAD family phosphatase [Erythrobacter sp.]